MEQIDINLLPKAARKQLLEFYEFLLTRHWKKTKKSTSSFDPAKYFGLVNENQAKLKQQLKDMRDEWN